MLAWMIYSTALGVVLVIAARCAEPAVRRAGLPTRVLWLAALVTTLGWSARTFVRDISDSTRAVASSASADAPSVPVQAASSGLRDGPRLSPQRHIASSTTDSTARRLDLLLLFGWVTASMTCFAVMLGSFVRLHRIRTSLRVRKTANVTVLLSRDLGPAVVGVVRPSIVLPEWIASLDDEAARMVVLHEGEHVRARDPLMLLGAATLVAALPWNPALWVAFRRLRQAIEIDCDVRVLRTGLDAKAYCTLLLDVGERSLSGAAPLVAFAEPQTLLERRIDSMLTRRGVNRWSIVGLIGAVGLIAAACAAPRLNVSPREELARAMSRQTPPASRATRLRHSASGPALDTVRSTVRALPKQVQRGESDSLIRAMKVLADSVVRSDYPEIITRVGGPVMVLGLVVNEAGGVRRHALRRQMEKQQSLAALLKETHIDTISARTRGVGAFDLGQWQLNVLFVIEGEGPVHGSATYQAWISQ